MKCKYCNFENKPGDKYCENCGASIENNTGMNDISSIPVPPPLSEGANPPSAAANNAPQSGNSYQGSGVQSNPYGQPNNGYQGYSGQPNPYGQPNNGYQGSGVQPNPYGQPNNGYQGYSGQPNPYGQPNNGYQGYNGQPNPYGQPNMYNQQPFGYDPMYYNNTDESPKYVEFGEAITLFFKNYVNFKGRSTRSEFWYAFLFTWLVGLGAGFIGFFMGKTASNILSYAIDAVFLVPNLSIEVRRLHDAGKSGWWVIGSILAMIVMGYSTIAGILHFSYSFEAIGALIGLFAMVTLVLGIVLLIFWCRPSVGANQWGAPARPVNRR